jgi:hypothetical protein
MQLKRPLEFAGQRLMNELPEQEQLCPKNLHLAERHIPAVFLPENILQFLDGFG